MTQDEHLGAALTRLAAALASLEAASRRRVEADQRQGRLEAEGQAALADERDRAVSRVQSLEAANEEVARLLKDAVATLGAILSNAGPGRD